MRGCNRIPRSLGFARAPTETLTTAIGLLDSFRFSSPLLVDVLYFPRRGSLAKLTLFLGSSVERFHFPDNSNMRAAVVCILFFSHFLPFLSCSARDNARLMRFLSLPLPFFPFSRFVENQFRWDTSRRSRFYRNIS